jgi:hypothetical protein
MTDQEKADQERQDAEQGGDDVAALRREAAKHRTRAKEAEEANGKLAERLKVAQRAEMSRLAAEHLADGADIFRDGEVEFDSLLSDEGDVDPAKVTAAAEGVIERSPHWAKRPTPQGGVDGGKGAATEDDTPLSFGEALKSA